jgi:AcrR family transcriptional regulator
MIRKQRRGEDTAERLLDAALAVHARKGPEGFTVHAVVAESSISLGSLYHHFGSFDGLAAALYTRSMCALLDTIVLAVERATTARAGIGALVRSYLVFTETRSAEARFIHASSYATFLPRHSASIEAAKLPRISRLFAWLKPHVRGGRVIDLPPALFEVLVIGPVAEASRRWLAGAKDIDLDVARDVLSERVWEAVRLAPR